MALGTISDLDLKVQKVWDVKNHPRSKDKVQNDTQKRSRNCQDGAEKPIFINNKSIKLSRKRVDLRQRVLCKKPFLSKTHREQRLTFAKKYVSMSLSF